MDEHLSSERDLDDPRDGEACSLEACRNMRQLKPFRATSKSAYAPYSWLDIARPSTGVFWNEHLLAHTHKFKGRSGHSDLA